MKPLSLVRQVTLWLQRMLLMARNAGLAVTPSPRLSRIDPLSRLTRVPHASLLLVLLGLGWGASRVSATPTTAAQARAAVQQWFTNDPAPLKTPMAHVIGTVTTYYGSGSTPLYYVVALRPSGYVVVSAEDRIEPIITFAPRGVYAVGPKHLLSIMLNHDLPRRMAYLKKQTATPSASGLKVLNTVFNTAQRKWAGLLKTSSGLSPLTNGIASVTDERVAPLLSSTWSQNGPNENDALACYNYYTPQYNSNTSQGVLIPGNANNDCCGCVATAMAQLMYFWQWPQVGVGTAVFPVTVAVEPAEASSVNYNMPLRGGNGSGGPYLWSSMTANPTSNATAAQCQAIGALCADAGATVSMSYAANGSGAYDGPVPGALTSVFKYTNAMLAGSDLTTQGDISALLPNMINPDFDAGMPVLFGIQSTSEGHEIVGDGYGYDGATLYTHLNMGWSGDDNAWYNLPTINEPDQGVDFTTINACVYNVYKAGTGEVISGRVVDSTTGNPITGATVTATYGTTTLPVATTNAEGIYAFAQVPSATAYKLTGAKAGYTSAFINVTTGTSISTPATESSVSTTTGNLWLPTTLIKLVASGPAQTVVSPTFTPVAGVYAAAQSVIIATTTPGAIIRYTIDGSVPSDTNGTVYTVPVNIAVTTTLQAIAYESGWTDSTVTKGVYTITGGPGQTVVTPTFTPVAGVYAAAQSVIIATTTPGAAIRYTIDGSTPTDTTGTIYTTPVNIAVTTTLKAIAYETGWTDSAVFSGVYTINTGTSGPGDWWMFQHDTLHSGRSPFNGPSSAAKKWSLNLAAGLTSPVLDASGNIYICDGADLVCVKPNGTQSWVYAGTFDTTPAVGANGTIYAGATDNNLYAISAAGVKLWAFPTGGTVSSSPAIGPDGTIYFGSQDDKLYAITSSGTLSWSYTTGGKIEESSPAIGTDGTVYIGSDDNNLYAISAPGTLKWKYATGDKIQQSSPAIDASGNIYVGSNDKSIYAISSTGTKLWSYATSGIIFGTTALTGSSGVAGSGTIYVESMDDHVYALNMQSGTVTWKNQTSG